MSFSFEDLFRDPEPSTPTGSGFDFYGASRNEANEHNGQELQLADTTSLICPGDEPNREDMGLQVDLAPTQASSAEGALDGDANDAIWLPSATQYMGTDPQCHTTFPAVQQLEYSPDALASQVYHHDGYLHTSLSRRNSATTFQADNYRAPPSCFVHNNAPVITHPLPESSSAAQQREYLSDAVADPFPFGPGFSHDFGFYHPYPPPAHQHAFLAPVTAGAPQLGNYSQGGPGIIVFGPEYGQDNVLQDAQWMTNLDIAFPVNAPNLIPDSTPHEISVDKEYLPLNRFKPGFVKRGVLFGRIFVCRWGACDKAMHLDDYVNDGDGSKDDKFQLDVATHLKEHENRDFKRDADGKFHCRWGQCTERLSDKRALSRHVRSDIHDIALRFCCPHCQVKTFIREQLLQRHMDRCVENNAPMAAPTDENVHPQVSANGQPQPSDAMKRRKPTQASRPAKRRKVEA